MEINNKLSIDLYVILILQLLWSSFGFIFEEYHINKSMIYLILLSYSISVVVHILLSKYLINKKNIILYVKWYAYALIVLNTILIGTSDIPKVYIIIALCAIFIISKYINKNLISAMNYKRPQKGLAKYGVVLAGSILGTYIPAFAILVSYIIVNVLNIYIYQKHVYLINEEGKEIDG